MALLSGLSTPNGVCVYSTVNGLCMRVNWQPVSGAASYSVYRSEIPHDNFSLVASGVVGLTYFDNPNPRKTLNAFNRWYYSVAAFDGLSLTAVSSPSAYLPYGEMGSAGAPRPGLSYWSLLF